MRDRTVYIKLSQMTEVYEPDVYLKDIADIHCIDKTLEAKIKTVKVAAFPKILKGNRRVESYVGDLMEILTKMEQMAPGIQVNNIGVSEFVVKYRPDAGGVFTVSWLKTAVVAAVSFCGGAFAIMTFNNDANVTDVFGKIYYLVTGMESDGMTVLEISYSLGLALGILVFFNHFAAWKLTVDPTPIEVEMRLYENNVNQTLIQNDQRKERGIDVS